MRLAVSAFFLLLGSACTGDRGKRSDTDPAVLAPGGEIYALHYAGEFPGTIVHGEFWSETTGIPSWSTGPDCAEPISTVSAVYRDVGPFVAAESGGIAAVVW